jgi:hypothetical protein
MLLLIQKCEQIMLRLVIRVFWDLALCSLVEVDRRFIVRTASIIRALMMEVVLTSEMSVCFETTQRYVPEDSHHHTRRRENMESHMVIRLFYVNRREESWGPSSNPGIP